MRKAILGLFCIALMGCAQGDDESPYTERLPPAYDSTFTGENNAGTLNGDLVGGNTEDTNALFRELELTTVSGSSGLTVYKPILTQYSGDDVLRFKIVITVKNTSQDRAYCGVKLKGLILKVDGGDQISTNLSEIEIIGGIGLANSKYFKYCLAPGETGIGYADLIPTETQAFITAVFDDGQFNLFRDATDFQVGGVVYSSAAAAQPTMALVPTAYSYGDTLSVDAENPYPDAARVRASKSYFVLYHNVSKPIWMDKLNSSAILSQMVDGDGGTATFEGEAVPFAGGSSKVRFYFYFTN